MPLKKTTKAAQRAETSRANLRRLERKQPMVEELQSWAEDKIIVPTGLRRGKKWVFEDFQVDWLRDFLASETREIGLSVARKNGKSGMCAVLLAAFLCGPFKFDDWRGLVTSLTGSLSGELRLQLSQIRDSSNLNMEVFNNFARGKRGEMVSFLSADKSTGFATGSDVALLDEGGLLQENKRELWGAVYSSVSGRDGKFGVISIQGDGPMFAEMKERANGKSVKFHEFVAPADSDPFAPATWELSNPGLGTLKSLSYLFDASEKAQQTPADLPLFLAHDLNMPQSPTAEMLCSVQDWKACLVDVLPEKRGPCYLGVDLGGATSLSAVTAYWPETSRFELFGGVPAVPDLRSRGKTDTVGGLYVQMHERGELYLSPGRVVDAGMFLKHAFAKINFSICCAGADFYKKSEVLQAFEDAKIFPRMEFRSGKDGGQDISAFQRAVMTERIRTTENLLMLMCLRSCFKNPNGL